MDRFSSAASLLVSEALPSPSLLKINGKSRVHLPRGGREGGWRPAVDRTRRATELFLSPRRRVVERGRYLSGYSLHFFHPPYIALPSLPTSISASGEGRREERPFSSPSPPIPSPARRPTCHPAHPAAITPISNIDAGQASMNHEDEPPLRPLHFSRCEHF